MSQQWEVCRVVDFQWSKYVKHYIAENKVAVYFYSPQGVVTKWPSVDSFAQVVGILGTRGWELVAVQHATHGGGSMNSENWLLGRLYEEHPTDKAYKFEHAELVAYFKRPIEAGRSISDALGS